MQGFDVNYLLIVLVSILLSMTLHEAMHAFASYWLGDDTAKLEGRLTLNPIAHIDPLLTLALPMLLAIVGAPIFGAAKPVPFNPARLRFDEFGMAIVGAAGPLTNLVLAFVAFGIWVGLNPAQGSIAYTFLQTFTFVNLGFFVFNMLPLPPLDGSRVLYAIAPDGIRRLMKMIEQYSLFVVFAVILLFNRELGSLMSTVTMAILQLFARIFGVNIA